MTLHDTLEAAVAHEIITEGQARDIESLEPVPAVPGPAARLGPLVAEAVGYVGGALAVVAGFVLAGQYWEDLRPAARVAVLAIAAVATLGAGAFLRAVDGPLDRLRGVLWVLSAAAMGGTVGVALQEYTDLVGERIGVAAAVAAAAYGLVLWRLRVRALQQLVVAISVAVTVVAGMATLDLDDFAGLALWSVGVAWLLLAWQGWIQPYLTGLLAGSAAALVGPSITPDDRYGWILVVGLLTAIALIGLSIPLRLTPLLGLGIFGIVSYVPRIIFQFFGDSLGAPLSLLLTGLVLVSAALAIARGGLGRGWRVRR